MITSDRWNDVKLKRAASMLEAGFSPEQVSSRLRLSRDRVREMAAEIEPTNELPCAEPHAHWRRRKREEIGREIMGIFDQYLFSLTESSFPLDWATTRTLCAVSNIAYKWLRGDPLTSGGATILNKIRRQN